MPQLRFNRIIFVNLQYAKNREFIEYYAERSMFKQLCTLIKIESNEIQK